MSFGCKQKCPKHALNFICFCPPWGRPSCALVESQHGGKDSFHGPFSLPMDGMNSDCDGNEWFLVALLEQSPPCKMITFEKWLHMMALMPTMPCHTPEAPTRKTTGQTRGVTLSMHHLTCHTDGKAKSFYVTKHNKARPTTAPTFGTNPIDLMNVIQFKCLLRKELNLKALSCNELSCNTHKMNKAAINTHKKKVKNTINDTIKEIANLLEPVHCFDIGVQVSKAQKVAYGCLQNHTCKIAIALSKELYEASNTLSECNRASHTHENHAPVHAHQENGQPDDDLLPNERPVGTPTSCSPDPTAHAPWGK